jgi:hypothetical protein
MLSAVINLYTPHRIHNLPSCTLIPHLTDWCLLCCCIRSVRRSGDWEHAQRHGRGKLELSNGFVYDGGWVRNVMEGTHIRLRNHLGCCVCMKHFCGVRAWFLFCNLERAHMMLRKVS